MRPVEIFQGKGRLRQMMEGVNLTMMYCDNFCKCHIVPQYNNNKKLYKDDKKCFKVNAKNF
jgi:hypothetical protein